MSFVSPQSGTKTWAGLRKCLSLPTVVRWTDTKVSLKSALCNRWHALIGCCNVSSAFASKEKALEIIFWPLYSFIWKGRVTRERGGDVRQTATGRIRTRAGRSQPYCIACGRLLPQWAMMVDLPQPVSSTSTAGSVWINILVINPPIGLCHVLLFKLVSSLKACSDGKQ